MALDCKNLAKPFRKLRKSLKKISKRSSPDEVHDLRTHTLRVEATLHALRLDHKPKGRRVLRAVTPLRKRAGKVRDMDVLIGVISSLRTKSEDACRLQLLEHLAEQRRAGARKLTKITDKRRTFARDWLTRCSSSIQKNFNSRQGILRRRSEAIVLQLSGEIRSWPKLSSRNLYPLRLKLKELRYVLELSDDKARLVSALKQVTDTIGEWHNWAELEAIANDLAEHSGPCGLLQELRTRTQRQAKEALSAASRFKAEYPLATC